jgi:hypothetical protein
MKGRSMTASPNQPVPPLEMLLDVAEAAIDLSRLLALDGAWTGAEGSDSFTARSREKLAVLGDRIDAELAVTDQHISRLRNAFESYPEWFNMRIAEALNSDALTSSQRQEAPGKLAARNGDFATRAIELADSVMRRLPQEREDLRGKITTVRGDGPVATDFNSEMACGVGALVSMGAMAAGVGLESPPLFFAGAVGLAVVLVAC